MSPSPVHHADQGGHLKREINGPRPSPLKISKESHLIHKASLSSSSSLSSAAASAKSQQQRHPVIIYTHSPKIIHTQARDFMALVQKLTGLSPSDGSSSTPPLPPASSANASPEANRIAGSDEATSSSVLTDENNCAAGDTQVSSSVAASVFDQPPNRFFADIPLFTPNSSEFFCSARPYYRFQDSVFSPANMSSSISPSVMEVLKAFPEF